MFFHFFDAFPREWIYKKKPGRILRNLHRFERISMYFRLNKVLALSTVTEFGTVLIVVKIISMYN